MAKNVHGAGYFISRKMGKAINDYEMVKAGDRVLVGVSGGKDSLTLLTLLQERKKWVPIDYEVIAVHIRTDYRCGNCMHKDSLQEFFEKGGYKYYILDIEILKNPDGTKNQMSCFWCSWNKRKAIFNLAGELKANKVAFGHHKDDIVQTTLMNIVYLSEISTMSPKVSMFKGELDIIRPLAYVKEKEISRYARDMNLPVKQCKCPFGENSKRALMKKIIKELETTCPNVKDNIFNALKRIKKDYLV